MASVYDSERLAAAYARDRPPIHEQILRSARLGRRADRALDIGCGAGLSTAALAPLTRRAIGLEPISTMLTHRRTVAPHASFVVGQAERLPFAAGSFDLVSAAGSLNYADLPSALAEIARVLTRDGTFLLYDFSTGRRSVSGDDLADWFDSFEQRFPWPPGWEPLDVRELALATYGLRLLDYTDLEIRLPMGLDAYLRYMLSEANVDNAIARGACSGEQARDWCLETLKPVFADGEVTVVIPGYIATLARLRRWPGDFCTCCCNFRRAPTPRRWYAVPPRRASASRTWTPTGSLIDQKRLAWYSATASRIIKWTMRWPGLRQRSVR